MLPVFAIIGRPNVGKSTLFNRLTRSRDALVADLPGVTRDRQYGIGMLDKQHFMLIDTGGIEDQNDTIHTLVHEQIQEAILQADYLLFVVDISAGITEEDKKISQKLRTFNKKVIVLANKSDNQHQDIDAWDAYALGFKDVHSISAKRGRGVKDFLTKTFSQIINTEIAIADDLQDNQIRLAFVGKPNVGKSTLVNKILGENRVIVSNQPGTTRNRIAIPFQHQKQSYLLIDTAGIRPKRKVIDKIEKFSIIQTLQTIHAADIVLLVLDALDAVTEQDLRLIGYVLNLYKPFVLIFNKADLLDNEAKIKVKNNIDRKLKFTHHTPIHFISAIHRTQFSILYRTIKRLYRQTKKKIPTSLVNEALKAALENHQPPLVRGKAVKLNYAHLGQHQPTTVIIHGTRLKSLPRSYLTYLNHFFQRYLRLDALPIVIRLKEKIK
jgi:GTP-binding protein